MAAKLTKRAVRYRPAFPFGPTPNRRCGTCAMFRPPAGCTLVAGAISPRAVCDRYAPEGTPHV